MRWQDVRRSAAGPGLSIIIVLTGALSLSPIAHGRRGADLVVLDHYYRGQP